MGETPFAQIWTEEFHRDLTTKRKTVARSLTSLTHPDSDYAAAHKLMLRLYDAVLQAVERELAVTHLGEPTG